MKTPAELEQFYQTGLQPELQSLERQRQAAVRRMIVVGLVLVPLAAGGGLLLAAATRSPLPLVFLAGAAVIVAAAVMRACCRDYVRQFKATVIDRLVRFVDENLRYDPAGRLDEATFIGCQIFQQHPDRYQGEDLVAGRVGATDMAFSEVHAEYKTTTHDSKGRPQTHWHTIFRGVLFWADFNKDFQGRTVVLPDTAERWFGRFGQMLQSWNIGRGELVKLEDPEFERLFAVYADDQVEARYILSTSLMKRIVDFRRKTEREISLSFIGARVYVALPGHRDLFEPRLLSSVAAFEPVRQYFEDLHLLTGIVEDLHLNLRIWSKEEVAGTPAALHSQGTDRTPRPPGD